MKYKSKPKIIDAIQWTGKNIEEICNFVGDSLMPIARQMDYDLNIKTLEGIHRADKYDYIIKGIKGEFYPCKPDIFELSYEAVNEQT